VNVLVVAEYYPRAGDPVGGIWAHRQALATRDAGAEVRVLVLHRPLPPLSAVRSADAGRALAVVGQPRTAQLDGLSVEYVRYLSPPRPMSYASWGAWAAPLLGRAMARVRREFPFDLIHAHYAVPAGDAVRRAADTAPLVVSVHGHDVQGAGSGGTEVATTLRHARLVLANSAGTARRCDALGARASRVVHLGADVGGARTASSDRPTLVTVGHLAARKRHADVIAALALLRDRHPELRYVIVGDGPERSRLDELAASLGVGDRVELRGQLPNEAAIAVARTAALFVMPSVDEAFGVAYIEAMAGGVPAIGCRGEDGPEEIAGAGDGIVLVGPGDVPALAERIDALLSDRPALQALGAAARETVEREFTWDRCGVQTVAAYEHVLGGG
jgi:glycosyltransferase involved in cell wall biosynthesis